MVMMSQVGVALVNSILAVLWWHWFLPAPGAAWKTRMLKGTVRGAVIGAAATVIVFWPRFIPELSVLVVTITMIVAMVLAIGTGRKRSDRVGRTRQG
jgi:hypothetical protein